MTPRVHEALDGELGGVLAVPHARPEVVPVGVLAVALAVALDVLVSVARSLAVRVRVLEEPAFVHVLAVGPRHRRDGVVVRQRVETVLLADSSTYRWKRCSAPRYRTAAGRGSCRRRDRGRPGPGARRGRRTPGSGRGFRRRLRTTPGRGPAWPFRSASPTVWRSVSRSPWGSEWPWPSVSAPCGSTRVARRRRRRAGRRAARRRAARAGRARACGQWTTDRNRSRVSFHRHIISKERT